MATGRKSSEARPRSGAGSERDRSNDSNAGQSAGTTGGEPDVLLDVPNLAVEEVALEVDNLHARIALDARLGDLIELHVGADVQAERVALELKGVEAQAHLKARLDNVLAIMERALDTADQHPELLIELGRSAGNGAGQLGDIAGQLGQGGDQTGEEQQGEDAQATSESSGSRRRGRSGANGGDSGSEPRRQKAGSSRG
jgi:hypothetical protein